MSAAKWAEMPVLAFDTETTGVDTATDRIITAALVELRPSQPGHRPVTWSYVVDPGIEIPDEAAAVHGYTRARAAAEATHTPDQMLFEIAGRLALWMGKGFPVVAYNAAYDLSLLEHECHRHGVDGLATRLDGKVGPVVDPHVLDKQADPYRKGGRKLVDVAAHYGVVVPGAHGAAADAVAAARMWPRIMDKHARKFTAQTLGSLHESQVGWRRSQMDGLRAYFDKKGIEHDGCAGEWPLHASARALAGQRPAGVGERVS